MLELGENAVIQELLVILEMQRMRVNLKFGAKAPFVRTIKDHGCNTSVRSVCGCWRLYVVHF